MKEFTARKDTIEKALAAATAAKFPRVPGGGKATDLVIRETTWRRSQDRVIKVLRELLANAR